MIELLVIASHNEGKVQEIRELLTPFGIKVRSAAELQLPEPEETGSSFIENADIKSLSAAKLSGQYALADDSGLCIPKLGGDPGIYSARWAGKEKDFTMAFARIERELMSKILKPNDVEAYFTCVLSLAAPDGTTTTFTGEVHGKLVFPPRGSHGFGYDPIFQPYGHQETFGEMDAAKKHSMSHRAKAFEQFASYVGEKRAS